MIPAIIPIREMQPESKFHMRCIIKSIIQSRIVTPSLGLEATEECIGHLYDIGYIKFSLEPRENNIFGGRVMLYDKIIKGYFVVDKIEIDSV